MELWAGQWRSVAAYEGRVEAGNRRVMVSSQRGERVVWISIRQGRDGGGGTCGEVSPLRHRKLKL